MKLQINKEDQKEDVYSITNVAGIKSENKVSPNEKEYYISLVRISIIKYQKIIRKTRNLPPVCYSS